MLFFDRRKQNPGMGCNWKVKQSRDADLINNNNSLCCGIALMTLKKEYIERKKWNHYFVSVIYKSEIICGYVFSLYVNKYNMVARWYNAAILVCLWQRNVSDLLPISDTNLTIKATFTRACGSFLDNTFWTISLWGMREKNYLATVNKRNG